MKHILSITRRVQSLVTSAHVKALSLAADKADAIIDNADVAQAAVNDQFDKAVDRYFTATAQVKAGVDRAEATRHDAIIEARRLGFAI
jgi:hypothetical protein